MAIFAVLLFIVANLLCAVPMSLLMEWGFANGYQITAIVAMLVLVVQALLELFGIILFIHAIREEFFT